MARKNLEEESPPAWRDWFYHSYSTPVFLKRFQHYRRLNANAVASPPEDA
jgi:hypothetical protein